MTSALVVSRFFPYNAQRVHGLYQRLGTQIQALAKIADRVECLFLVPEGQGLTGAELREHEARLRELWSPAVSLKLAPTVREAGPKDLWGRVGKGLLSFHAQLIASPVNTPAALAAVSAALDARPDIVLAHRLSAMATFMQLATSTPQKVRGAPIFLDMDDIEHVAAFRRLVRDPGWPAERLLLLQLPRLILAEMEALRLAAATFVCSDGDRRYLARFAGRGRVETVPNSIAFPTPPDDGHATEPLVLFVGAMGYRPNAQAADSLVQHIWPHIRAQVPDANLAIVGIGPEHTTSYHSPVAGVTFTGFVDDLRPWYRRARVVCCPIHHGGGTRVKIIEAAANAKAIISSHLGAEGLDFADGTEIILRDAAREIAAECVRLLRDPAAAAALGRAARQKASSVYERRAVVDKLVGIFGTAGNLRVAVRD